MDEITLVPFSDSDYIDKMRKAIKRTYSSKQDLAEAIITLKYDFNTHPDKNDEDIIDEYNLQLSLLEEALKNFGKI